MSDNVPITAGSGTNIATDQLGTGEHVQYVKIMDGTLDGTGKIPGTAANGLAVDVTRVAGNVAVTNAGLTNLDVALSTRTKPSDQQHVIVDSSAAIAVTGPITDTQIRATPLPVSGTVGVTNLDVALSTRLKPADTLAGVTTVGAVTSITNPVTITAAALPIPGSVVATGNITNTQAIQVASGGCQTVIMNVYGTWTGTIQPQISVDGTTFTNVEVIPFAPTGASVTTITGNGNYYVVIGGSAKFQLLGASVASGTAVVTLAASPAGFAQLAIQSTAANLNATVVQATGTNLHVVVDTAPTTAVTGPVTDTQIRATPLPVSLASIPNEPNLDVALSTRLKPADTLAAVTTLGSITSALPTGTNVIGHVIIDSGSTTAVTALPANASVNVNQLAGTTTSVNSGVKDLGTLRVVLATDQPALTNKLLVTPDSVALPANQSTNVNQIGGTNVVTGGVAGIIAVGGNVANAVTATANPVPVGGVFVTAPATLTTGQTATAQFTAAQNLKQDITTIAGTAPTTAGKLDVKGADGDVFVRQATGTNLHTVIDSGTVTTVSTVTAVTAITNALPAGTALLGKTGIDQTTPGTTNGVSLAQVGSTTIATGNGVVGAGVQRVAIASDNTAFAVNSTLSAETTKVIGTARVLGNAGAILDGATAASVPANAIYEGMRGATTVPTAVTDGQMVGAAADKYGRTIAVLGAPRDLVGTAMLNSASGTTVSFISAGAAGVFNDIVSLVITNETSTATIVSLSDNGAAGTIYKFALAANGGIVINFPTPLPQGTAAAAWQIFNSAAVACNYIAVFLKNK